MQRDPTHDDDFPEAIRARLADRIRDGLLPGTRPLRIFAGHGSGWPCAVCDRDIPPTEIELELEFVDGEPPVRRTQLFLVHHACYDLWDEVRPRSPGRGVGASRDAPPSGC